MAQDYTKWWNKFYTIADGIVWDRPHYYKEKYWRFDVTVHEWVPDGVFDRIINEVEAESEHCCQVCAKHRKQYWTDGWWIEHFCLPCYIKVWIKLHWKRFIRKLKRLWKRIN